jgi:hypothetical protein
MEIRFFFLVSPLAKILGGIHAVSIVRGDE